MALYKGSLRVCPIVPKWRGFWAVTIKGFPGTIVDCGTQKTIGESGSVTFKFAEAGEYTFIAEYAGEVETKTVTLVDGSYFIDVNWYVGFTFLEYLQGDGQAYINSGLILDNNSSVESKFQYTEEVSSFLYGGRVAFNDNAFGFSAFGNGVWQAGYGDFTADKFGDADTNIHIIKQNKNLVYLDKVLKATIEEQIFSTQNNAFIFALNQSGDTRTPSRSKIWYLKIWNNEELVREFVPVKRNSDNKSGMIDLVSGQFFTNDGTGEFIAGPEAE